MRAAAASWATTRRPPAPRAARRVSSHRRPWPSEREVVSPPGRGKRGARELDAKAAKLAAFELLARKAWSARELTIRLKRRGAPDDVARDVVVELAARGYVDDAGFARFWAESRARGRRGGRGLRGERRGRALSGGGAASPARSPARRRGAGGAAASRLSPPPRLSARRRHAHGGRAHQCAPGRARRGRLTIGIMRVMTGSELRQKFLDYFARHGHTVVRSSPLVPAQDPTLLFTNAGMVQFKGVFLGEETRDYVRAASAQKCVRAGGKHNDLENVGRTARHHTFFEMLGNFSFGDYFKPDAVAFCWELLTRDLGLPPARLKATVYTDDDDAFALWRKVAGMSGNRILRLGEKDNFWSMGDTGPCGPCSEVHFHQGDHIVCAEEQAGGKCLGPACDCDRWLEIWNLVFMQFNRDASGKMTPLPKPSIDTGMGLERVAAVMQGKGSSYETDLFRPLIARVERLVSKRYGADTGHDVSMQVIA